MKTLTFDSVNLFGVTIARITSSNQQHCTADQLPFAPRQSIPEAAQILHAVLSSSRYAIISACRADSSAEFNNRRHAILKRRLLAEGAVIAELGGQWEGVEERSFLVLGVAPWNVADLAILFNQDAFIYSGRLFSRGVSGWDKTAYVPDSFARSVSVFHSQPHGNFSKLRTDAGEIFFTLNF